MRSNPNQVWKCRSINSALGSLGMVHFKYVLCISTLELLDWLSFTSYVHESIENSTTGAEGGGASKSLSMTQKSSALGLGSSLSSHNKDIYSAKGNLDFWKSSGINEHLLGNHMYSLGRW